MDDNTIITIVAIIAVAAICITALIVDVFIGLLVVATLAFFIYTFYL